MDLRIGVLGLFEPDRLTVKARSVDGGAAELSAQNLAGKAFRASGDVRIGVPGRIERAYPGAVTVTSAGGRLRAVVTMPLEMAVASAVAAEAPHAPLEALKAQAVVARSYYLALQPRHGDCDFCDTTHCQFLREAPGSGHPATQAAAATRGMLLLHDGHHFGPMFFRSCGGATLTAQQAGLDGSLYPYFAVSCPACKVSPFRWEARLPREEAARLPSETARIELGRRYGWNRIASNSFTRTEDGEGVILRGAGEGHGLGLCQRGAAFLARSGQDYRAILSHYFPRTAMMLA